MPSKEYYRPYLTMPELVSLIDLCAGVPQVELMNNPTLMGTYQKLYKIKAVADINLSGPAYVTKGSVREQLKNSLALEDGPTISPQSRVDKRLAAYRKFNTNFPSCTPDEIDLAQTYRYENNLMSEEEAEKYVNKLMGFPDEPNNQGDEDEQEPEAA